MLMTQILHSFGVWPNGLVEVTWCIYRKSRAFLASVLLKELSEILGEMEVMGRDWGKRFNVILMPSPKLQQPSFLSWVWCAVTLRSKVHVLSFPDTSTMPVMLLVDCWFTVWECNKTLTTWFSMSVPSGWTFLEVETQTVQDRSTVVTHLPKESQLESFLLSQKNIDLFQTTTKKKKHAGDMVRMPQIFPVIKLLW